ncbi:hypothetical protein [Robiginitalea aurantiaca]|uniref:DUF502 domain-containing protein n=1 Tax=Robiginitalea aurantiaca TaxID=3056915 RepID=A0ABT7WF61_9FLAO|nr:hypothetical protein [Robiginitalea aurantiaca]MDM9631562.1 hypothetical protein [Robiginitalea aurantiaca]
MNPAIRFIRTTITGGILFLLPLIILYFIFEKAYSILEVISAPISAKISESILGFDGSALITILLLIFICFAAGLLFRAEKIKKVVQKLEERVLIFIPGYSLIKSITADSLGEEIENKLIPIRIEDGENWLLGFLIEEGKTHSTVFLPDAPRYDAGEIRIMPSTSVVKLDISANKYTKVIKSYGVGAINWVE